MKEQKAVFLLFHSCLLDNLAVTVPFVWSWNKPAQYYSVFLGALLPSEGSQGKPRWSWGVSGVTPDEQAAARRWLRKRRRKEERERQGRTLQGGKEDAGRGWHKQPKELLPLQELHGQP